MVHRPVVIDPTLFDRVDALLEEALSLDPNGRERLLAGLEESDPTLAAELAPLLDCAVRADSFLDEAGDARDRLLARALDFAQEAPKIGNDPVGKRLGAYRIEEELARGFRSVVYRARREDEDWSQQVAIKVLTRGFDSDDVRRRFLAERQILTVLRHPHIATLLDGGFTDEGAPYFVMEFIDGVPVTEYCRSAGLNLRERVHICLDICTAVAFAHRHLVVHRDLKPSNILVTRDGSVKLLDFGIAKLLAPDSETGIDLEASALTVEVARPMTPRYASPEQLRGRTITTATDVYQLGLLFTELLAGVDNARVSLGVTADHGPVRSPGRLPKSGVETLPYALRDLRGDLDWVLLKALEADPGDRYASAAGLALDLENYEASRPVRARRATVPYVLRKFARRRPALTTSFLLAGLAMIVFTLTLLHYNRALMAERTAAMHAAERAEEVKGLLVSFIKSPDPYSGVGADARVSDVLEESETTIEHELEARPELQAELYGVLGDVYQSLTLHDSAARMRDFELDRLAELGVQDTFQFLQVRRERAQSLKTLGQLEEARTSLEDVQEQLSARFPGHAKERAIVEIALSEFDTVYGRPAEGLPHLEQAVRLAEQVKDDPLFQANVIESQAFGLNKAGRFEEARDRYRQALEILVEQRGADDPQLLLLKAAQAANLTNLGEYRESLAIYAEIIPPLEQRLGPLHRDVLNILNNRAYTYGIAGNPEDAADIHRDILERRRAKFGDIHRDVADSWQNIGSSLAAAGHVEKALEALNQAARIYPQVNQPGSPLTAYPHVTISILYAKQGKTELQEKHARQALNLLEGNVPASHPALLRSQCLLGDALTKQNQRELGISMMTAAAEGLEQYAGRFQQHLDACRQALTLARQGREDNVSS